MPDIKMTALSKKYGEKTALDSINLTLEGGHIYGLLGRNGAGKTTMLNILTDKIFATSGEVYLDKAQVSANRDALRKMYYMCEENLFPEDMRVKQAARWTGEFYPGYDRAYADSLFQRFGVNQNAKLRSLSTGYNTIFKFILAMASGAPVVLLDEPALGLDANHRDMMYREILEQYARDSSRTYVLSTHLIEEIAELIEYAVILREGRLLLKQSVEELLSSGYTVSGAKTAVDAFAAGRNVIGAEQIAGFASAYILDAQPGEVPEGLEISPMNLQKLFIQLTGKEGE